MLASLPVGGVAHFACHATVDPGDPLRSAVVLPIGDRLTVGQLLEGGLPRLRAAILSACESGVPGPYVLDEVVSLSGALLAAGCRGVLSTLWLVEDLSTALLMLRFYWEWRREQRTAPLALARAQLWQRATTDDEKCGFVAGTLVDDQLLPATDAQAIVKLIRQGSPGPTANSYEDPYYWAGFCYSGT